MRFRRRRTDRPEKALGRPGSSLEALEGRQLLSGQSHINFYMPSDLPPLTALTGQATVGVNHPLNAPPRVLSFLDNDGKVLQGVDRQGDEWTIVVHGPGVAIVSDATPNDGVLDDDIDTIQLIGTDPNTTFVSGQVVSSARLQTDGQVLFNRLIDLQGVHSIILNGFTLAQTVAPNPATVNEPQIFLPGGVQFLQFHNIEATNDLAGTIAPFNVVIGDPNQPLTFQPTIRLDSIFNTVVNSTATAPLTLPQTDPTVNILVNGQLHGIEIVSSTAAPIPAADQFALPTVGSTGRTAIRALGIDQLRVAGSARNVTVSRRATPFQNGFSGVDHIGQATFGGNADAVGLDVAGPIGRLQFLRGLGNPTGSSTAATSFGTPVANFGFPAFGLLGGLVTARRIGNITIGPANTVFQTPNNPQDLQANRQGTTNFFPRAGNALTHAAITSSGSIGATTVVGDAQASEIKAGFHYPSFVAGLDGTRSPSRIAPINFRGSLIDSVVSASVRPANFHYQTGTGVDGPGFLQGNLFGSIYETGALTPLNNTGTGFHARHKVGYLPPPIRPKRSFAVLVNNT